MLEQRIRTEPERFAAVLGARPRGRIVLETSPMYATCTRKVKTDRRDARALADACVLGAYRPAHRLSDPQRHVRARLLVRDAVVRTRTRYISLIRAHRARGKGRRPWLLSLRFELWHRLLGRSASE